MTEAYSPERRTALVLTGSGADGAYHAGVLRALKEAGVKIDLVCGRGIGAVAAVLCAVDGASRLWEANGLWRSNAVKRLYQWRWPIRLLLLMAGLVAGILVSPLVYLVAGFLAYLVGLLAGMLGLEFGSTVMRWYADVLATAFAPTALPTWLPRLIALVVIAGLATLLCGALLMLRQPVRRRARGPRGWTLLGAPLDASRASRHFSAGVWNLLRGGAALKTPPPDEVSRRFAELLNDNLGQPGFSELLLTVHDLDARRDLIFGLVREPFRRALFPPPGVSSPRRTEAFDLSGFARDHLVDVLRGALAIPGFTEPALLRMAPDTYWRGEAHRLVDRPAALSRLLEEAAAAGAEQVIIASAAPDPPGPHELSRPRLDPRARLSEQATSLETAALRDAIHHVHHRFRAVYEVRPEHNPVGAFDLNGVHDEQSDRRFTLDELMQHGYEDAHRDFIEPVVAASGDRIAAAPRG